MAGRLLPKRVLTAKPKGRGWRRKLSRTRGERLDSLGTSGETKGFPLGFAAPGLGSFVEVVPLDGDDNSRLQITELT